MNNRFQYIKVLHQASSRKLSAWLGLQTPFSKCFITYTNVGEATISPAPVDLVEGNSSASRHEFHSVTACVGSTDILIIWLHTAHLRSLNCGHRTSVFRFKIKKSTAHFIRLFALHNVGVNIYNNPWLLLLITYFLSFFSIMTQ